MLKKNVYLQIASLLSLTLTHLHVHVVSSDDIFPEEISLDSFQEDGDDLHLTVRTVVEGSSAVLPCSVSYGGFKAFANVEWYFENADGNQQAIFTKHQEKRWTHARFRGRLVPLLGANMLLMNTKKRDAGEFVCQVSFSAAQRDRLQSLTKKVILRVLEENTLKNIAVKHKTTRRLRYQYATTEPVRDSRRGSYSDKTNEVNSTTIMEAMPKEMAPVNYTTIVRPPERSPKIRGLFKRLRRPPIGNVPLAIRGELPEPIIIPINFTIFPTFLETVDVRLATCRIHIYVVKEWIDPRLQWDSDIYGLSGGTRVDPKTIWIPDFEPYNGLNKKSESKSPAGNAEALVRPSGKVRLTQFYVLTTYGQRSKGLFLPICEMRFASWTSGRFTIVNRKNFDFSRYTPSVQWTRQRESFTLISSGGYPEIRAKIVFIRRGMASTQ